MWPSRLEAALRREDGHVLIEASPEFAGHVVVGALRLGSQPVVRLALPGIEDYSTVLFGNALSDAFEETFGFRIFGYGMPIEYGLRLIAAQSSLLGKFTLAVASLQPVSPNVLRPLLELQPRQIRSVVAVPSVENRALVSGVRHLGSSDLALTLGEARQLASGSMDDERLVRIWEAVGGAYLSLVTEINRSVSVPPVALVDSPSGLPPGAAEQLIPVLIRQERWLEALQLALARSDERQFHAIFTQCAPKLLDRGLHEPLWRLVEQCPASVFEVSDEAMFFYFQVASAVNRHREIADQVRAYLRTNDAPDLRARWAVAVPTSSSMAEALRAFGEVENINTSRALAFLAAFEGDTLRAVDLLKKSIELAQVLGDRRATCMLALDVSHALVLGAQFDMAKQWAKWGLEKLLRWRVGDELLRVNLVNQAAYLELLAGELGAAESRLGALPDSESLLGIPMMEALVSTRADLAYVKGDLREALGLYRLYFDEYLPMSRAAMGAVDIVKTLARLGSRLEAESFLRSAIAVAGSSENGSASAALTLANAHARCAEGQWDRAAEECERVLALETSVPGAFIQGQAVLVGASAHAAAGRQQRGIEMLKAHKWAWNDLGESGWLLFTSTPEVTLDLRAAVVDDSARPKVRFLGSRKVVLGGSAIELSRRNAEIVALLLMRPTGYRFEELLLDVYGEDGRPGTLKAQLSRLRQTIEVDSQPYRLVERLPSDFRLLETHLASGNLSQALELYQGPLLPESEAPGIVRERERIDEALRQAVLMSDEAELMLRLARKSRDDLELWERAMELMPKDDPAYPLIRAQVRRIRGEWGL